jgi:hypothetical protein
VVSVQLSINGRETRKSHGRPDQTDTKKALVH